MRRDENHVTKRVMNMNVDGHKGRGRPKKGWMDCVKNYMGMKGVSADMTGNRTEWKRNTTPTVGHITTANAFGVTNPVNF